jgi:site-specific recombinase XerD
MDPFATQLQDQGYARRTIQVKLRVVAHCSTWLKQHKLGSEAVDAEQIKRFLAYRKRRGRLVSEEAVALQEMTRLVDDQNVHDLSHPLEGLSDRERCEQEFRHYLSQTRGLSPATQRNYLPIVSQFLNDYFADGPIQFDVLTPANVTAFVQRHVHGCRSSQARRVVKALRAYLRYLQHHGKISGDLAVCVPPVASWSLATLPAFLRPDQVQCVLDQCPRNTATGRRDYAVLLLLARLGLRAGEVAALTLDDIDWQAGSLAIRNKGGQWTRMPLPHEVGAAMVDYVVMGRPSCSDRHIFIRDRAPQVGFASSTSVSAIASRALSRAGITFPRQGAHLFRHTLATEMLRQGASLAEIAQLLRHQHPDTTRIYAKVDLAALRDLAPPWPGGVS